MTLLLPDQRDGTGAGVVVHDAPLPAEEVAAEAVLARYGRRRRRPAAG